MEFETRFKALNTQQQHAVDTIDGPVMVIAGPGTGKTELLSMRAAAILKKTDTLPNNILCLTFTDSGATAMRKRMAAIIGADAYKIAIHTFHSFGTDIINQNGQFFYQGANFRPSDELSSYEMLKSIFDELDYQNPLKSTMNGEYTYLRDTLATISELKRSGLTSDELLLLLDANDTVINAVEPSLASLFARRIDKTTPDSLQDLIAFIRQSGGDVPLAAITPLSRIMADSLEVAIQEAKETTSTKPVTAWRNAWMKKDDTGRFVLKSRERQTKLRAVSYIYYQYLAHMQEAELYDFDDMILRVVHAMEVFSELRFNLQEQYQYIMVDEFQDTNLAQMRILYNLTNNEANNGRPNILVVGDDDQAIYSFQGADVGNINGFRELYPETRLIVLQDNYRSTKQILSHAHDVVTKGSNRLENYIPGLNKQLNAHHTSEYANTVRLVECDTSTDERNWVVRSIKQSIEQGVPAASIAVLARRHHELVDLLPYFAQAHIPVVYERHDDVLELEIIKIIELIAQVLVALYEQRHQDANTLLPQLLSYPAFNINPLDLWHISLKAREGDRLWMEIMEATPHLTSLHTWLITQAQALAHAPLEQMLDHIIGVPERRISLEGKVTNLSALAQEEYFTSPLYDYFFSPEKRENTPNTYLTYLEALRTIRTKLREYEPDTTPTLQSFLEFIRLHRELGSGITSSQHALDHTEGAITLMTAHKAKGLEFAHVYIVGAVDSAWGEHVRTRSRMISYPENLPLSPAGDNYDERLRLFFVAMTRAKDTLTISYSLNDDTNKATLRASFLIGDTWPVELLPPSNTLSHQVENSELAWYAPIVTLPEGDMRSLLAPTLARYKLSSTHLNAFLDVSQGGPQAFLINNLLHFPTAGTPQASYGSAIHTTLQRTHTHLAATGKHRPLEDILHDYEENLRTKHLSQDDFHTYLQKGSDVLTHFLNATYDTFTKNQKAELNFANQDVYLGNAHLTGSLDLVDIHEGRLIVTDYKTGKPTRTWTGKTDYEKIKLHRYRQQLMFYELLVTHSRDYSVYTFDHAILQFVEPTTSGDIVALKTSFSDEELETFTRLIGKVWDCITTLSLPDTSSYEPTYKGILAFETDLLNM